MAHSQRQLVVQPINKQQQDHLLMQYASGVCMIYQDLELNQQQLDRLMYQMLAEQQPLVSKIHIHNRDGGNSLQNSGLTTKMRSEKQQLMIFNHKNSSPCGMTQTLATTGGAEKDNWREGKFQLIKTFKDAYLPELIELNQVFILPHITQEKLELLPKDITEEHRFKVHVKHTIKMMLRFLLLEKSNIPEKLRGKLSDFLKIIQLLLGSYRKSKDLKAKVDGRRKPQISRRQTKTMKLSDDLARSGGGTRSHHHHQRMLKVFLTQLPDRLAVMGATEESAAAGAATPSTNECNHVMLTTPSMPLQEDTEIVPFASPCPLVKVTTSENIKTISASQLPDSLVAMVAAAELVAGGAATPAANESKEVNVTKVSMPVSPLQAETRDHLTEDHQLETPLLDSAAIQVASPSTSVTSTLPPPLPTSVIIEGASLCDLVKSTPPSSISDSEVVLVASPCASVKVTSSENVKSVSASQLPEKLVAVAAAATQSVERGEVTPAENESKEAETPDRPVEDHQVAAPVPSPCSSEKSTLPSHNANSGVVEPTSLVTNPGCALVNLPCPSVQPITYENIEGFSGLLLLDNSATAAAEAAIGETATEVANGSKQLTTTTPIKPTLPVQAEIADHQAVDYEYGEAETSMARASSPGMHCRSANSICSLLNMNKMKRVLECTSSCSEVPPSGSMNGILMTFDHDAAEVESNAEHNAKRQKTQNDSKGALLDEIRSVNSMLIDTVVSIVNDNGTDVTASSNGGTLIKFSYTAVSLGPDLKSLLAASKMCIVMPVKLSVPVDYPRRSPVLVYDQRGEPLRKRMSDVSGKVDMLFQRALRRLPELMSVKDMARAWDASVRRVVMDYVQWHGGGTFSSWYGQWERC
ncbi:unnamed protein product [Urochloa decumbens]|uniref:ARC105/Med15 mediator subunit C-terminal domain-containing protein n=1 Tax=Urochloa decumbens TaxID=240449 RepID=A0ABC9CZV3_9POAL